MSAETKMGFSMQSRIGTFPASRHGLQTPNPARVTIPLNRIDVMYFLPDHELRFLVCGTWVSVDPDAEVAEHVQAYLEEYAS